MSRPSESQRWDEPFWRAPRFLHEWIDDGKLHSGTLLLVAIVGLRRSAAPYHAGYATSTRDLARLCDCSSRTIQRRLDEALRLGLLIREGGQGRATTRIWLGPRLAPPEETRRASKAWWKASKFGHDFGHEEREQDDSEPNFGHDFGHEPPLPTSEVETPLSEVERAATSRDEPHRDDASDEPVRSLETRDVETASRAHSLRSFALDVRGTRENLGRGSSVQIPEEAARLLAEAKDGKSRPVDDERPKSGPSLEDALADPVLRPHFALTGDDFIDAQLNAIGDELAGSR